MSLPSPSRQTLGNTSATYGAQVAAGTFHGDVNFGNGALNDLLRSLPIAEDAPFNAYRWQHDSACLPGTCVELLQEIYKWVESHDERCIFWLNGLAGTGKSTIARTLARRFDDQRRLGASFFFSRGGGDVGHAGRFVTSIAVQLGISTPPLMPHIRDALKERHNIAGQSLRDQWQQLVMRPLSKLGDNGVLFSLVVVVDALDECDDDKNIRIVIQLLAEVRLLETVRLRVFLTSRPEIPIRYGFSQMPNTEHQDFVLHNISPSVVDHDLSVFFEYNLKIVRMKNSLHASWPGKDIINCLIETAGGLFIWAATACRYIDEGRRFAAKRLETILSGSNSASTEPEKRLDEIYTAVLKQSVAPGFTDEEREEVYCGLRKTLGSIVVLFSLLSASSLCKLLSIETEDLDQTLNDLHSVLDIPQDRIQPLRLHHPSFRHYLLNTSRCQDPNFSVEEKQAHQVTADSCIKLMSKSLKQDICGFKDPGKLVVEVKRDEIERSLPPEVQYACLYWIEHVLRSCEQLRDDGRVHEFLREHLLHWLEALGWMGKVSEGVHALVALETLTTSEKCPSLSNFIHDARRFTLYNRPAVEQAPYQIYCSALIFAPTASIVRKQFANRIPGWISRLPRVEEQWNSLLQTLEGHSSSVLAVAFSPDGKTLASTSDDCTIRLWDADSGAALQTLKGHRSKVLAVAFSPDGKTLASASASELNTVRLWDAGSGAALQKFKGHSGGVLAVAFSPSGRTLVSASRNDRICEWDLGSGAVLQIPMDYSRWILAAAFSPDGCTLASGSFDDTVRLWDVASGVASRILEGHSRGVLAVAFSPDGKTLASGSYDRTVRLWDVASGVASRILEAHLSEVLAVAFSPDGKTLASGSFDNTVWLWGVESGTALLTMTGFSGTMRAVAFSPDGKTLASGSGYSGTVQLWDVGSDSALQTLDGHLNEVGIVAFSPNGQMLTSTSLWNKDFTIRLWDVRSGAVLRTLKGHSGTIRAVAFSPDGKTLASRSTADRTVRLWDAGSGAALQKLEDFSNSQRLFFSDDGRSLLTDKGALLLWSTWPEFRTISSSQILHAINVENEWVSLDTKRSLWLPPEYRPSCVCVQGNVLGLAYDSSRVSFMAFDFGKLH